MKDPRRRNPAAFFARVVLQCAGHVGGECCSSRHDLQGVVRVCAGSVRFSKRGGGEGMEFAEVTHANEKVAPPVEFHGVGRQIMAFARAVVLNGGTQATGDNGDVLRGPHCEGFRLLSQLSVDVRVSRDVKRKQMSRNRGSLGAHVDNVWRCDALLKDCFSSVEGSSRWTPLLVSTLLADKSSPRSAADGDGAAPGEGRRGRRRAPRRYF